MPHRLVLLWPAVFVSALTATVTAAPQSVSNLTWPGLLADRATVQLTNDAPTSEKWQASIVARPTDSQAPPKLVVDPATPIDVAQNGSAGFAVRLEDGAKVAPSADAHYVFILTREGG